MCCIINEHNVNGNVTSKNVEEAIVQIPSVETKSKSITKMLWAN